MRLIVITPEDTRNSEPILVSRLLTAGLERLHVRKPSFESNDYRRYLSVLDPVYYPRIVIHDYFELFSELGLGGIHLGGVSRRNEKIWETINSIPPKNISA